VSGGRPVTDLYLEAVTRAKAKPRHWVDVRWFRSKANAQVTAACLQEGYLRVKPGPNDKVAVVRGHRYVATPAPVEVSIAEGVGQWLLKIRC
jgi:hypothetical protein